MKAFGIAVYILTATAAVTFSTQAEANQRLVALESCTAQLKKDRYANFADLAAHETDFRVIAEDTQSDITIIAPHGGAIEIGTSEIATAIATNANHNLYVFEGLKEKNNRDLHVTSKNFDEPTALAITQRSRLAISIHGFKDEHQNLILVGGLNHDQAQKIASALKEFYPTEYPATRFKGETLTNIVNRAQQNGVQLELSTKLRKSLMADSIKLKQFADTINAALK